jgi:hypothetical protein
MGRQGAAGGVVKFNCDWFKQRRAARWDAAQDWTRTFAWLPLRLAESDCRWLEPVEWRITPWDALANGCPDWRRKFHIDSGLFSSEWAEYRSPQP